jgi:hypothetical protein
VNQRLGAGVAIQSWEDRQLVMLRRRFPNWQIWTVRYATTRQTAWCARPKGAPVATVNVWSADELVKAIRDQS